MTIKGTIESIEYRNTAGHEKKVVTLVPDHRQRAFDFVSHCIVKLWSRGVG